MVDVTVTEGGKAAKVKFFSETAAVMAIFRVVGRVATIVSINDKIGIENTF